MLAWIHIKQERRKSIRLDYLIGFDTMKGPTNHVQQKLPSYTKALAAFDQNVNCLLNCQSEIRFKLQIFIIAGDNRTLSCSHTKAEFIFRTLEQIAESTQQID